MQSQHLCHVATKLLNLIVVIAPLLIVTFASQPLAAQADLVSASVKSVTSPVVTAGVGTESGINKLDMVLHSYGWKNTLF